MMSLLVPIIFIFYIYFSRKKPAIALATCPFICGAIFILGTSEENQISTYGSIVILFVTLIVILFSKYDDDTETWPRIFVKYFLSVILCIVVSVFIAIISSPFSLFLIVFIFVFVGSVIAYSLTSRSATASFVFSTIGASIRQNLPLPMALESAATGFSDARIKILQNIKEWLLQGYSLSESIRRGYPNCPGHALSMIATAERIDQLPSAIMVIENNLAAKEEERNRVKPIHPIYPVILLIFLLLILWSVMLFVMPQFATAMAEMTDVGRLPAITRYVIATAKFTLQYLGLTLILILLFIIFMIIISSIYKKFVLRRPEDPSFLSLIGDRIKWRLPILHWFERNYSMIQTVEMLRLSLNAGCTVNEAIANTIDLDINTRFRDHIKEWLEKVEAGYNISESAENSELGSALAWAFDDKVNQGNTITILETLEAFYRTNYNYSINIVRFILWPCIVLCIGIIVGTIAVAFFLPSAQIINNLANQISP